MQYGTGPTGHAGLRVRLVESLGYLQSVCLDARHGKYTRPEPTPSPSVLAEEPVRRQRTVAARGEATVGTRENRIVAEAGSLDYHDANE